jgi:5-methylcytosine-specific restriction endonuclease McrA
MKKGYKFSDESKEKMRKAALGRKHSPETKIKIGKGAKGRPSWNKGKTNPYAIGNTYGKGHIAWNRGIKMSDEFREKNRQSQYKRWAKVIPNYSYQKDGDKIRRLKRIADNGGFHSKGEWETLKAQYNWTCPSCTKSEPFDQEYKFLTKDHIVPLIKGGTDNIENIQPLCKSCNSIKSSQSIKY